MKKLLASLVFMALLTSMLASNKKVITLSFDPKDYPVTLDKQGAAIFNSSVRPLIFKEEPHMPGIPYVPVTILVASNEQYKAVSYTTTDYPLFDNALVCQFLLMAKQKKQSLLFHIQQVCTLPRI